MAWLVLSTSSLLDNNTGGHEVPKEKLESLFLKIGYKSVILQNIMRNSANITTAIAPHNLDKYRGTTMTGSIREESENFKIAIKIKIFTKMFNWWS